MFLSVCQFFSFYLSNRYIDRKLIRFHDYVKKKERKVRISTDYLYQENPSVFNSDNSPRRPYALTFSGLISVCLLPRLDASAHKKLAKIFLSWPGVDVEKGEMFFSI